MVEVAEADRKRMQSLAHSSSKLARETGWGSEEERATTMKQVNERRVAEGLEPLEAEPVPDELEFYEKARRLGLLRRADQPAR